MMTELNEQEEELLKRYEREPLLQGAHFHKDEQGRLVKCYHSTKNIVPPFIWWATGFTIGYPIEHFLWEKVWPFYWILELIGMPVSH